MKLKKEEISFFKLANWRSPSMGVLLNTKQSTEDVVRAIAVSDKTTLIP